MEGTAEAEVTQKLLPHNSGDVVIRMTGASSDLEHPSHSTETASSTRSDSAVRNFPSDNEKHINTPSDGNEESLDTASAFGTVEEVQDMLSDQYQGFTVAIVKGDSSGLTLPTVTPAFIEIAAATLTGVGLSAMCVLTATRGAHLAGWWTIPSAGLAWAGLRASLLCKLSETCLDELGLALAGSGVAALVTSLTSPLGHAVPTVLGICLPCVGVTLRGAVGAGLAGAGLTLVGLTAAQFFGELALRCMDGDWRMEASLGLFTLSLTQVIGFGMAGAGIAWAGLSKAGALEKKISAMQFAGAGLFWTGMAFCGEVTKDGYLWVGPAGLALCIIRAMGYMMPLVGITGVAVVGVLLTEHLEEPISGTLASVGLMAAGLALVDLPGSKLAVAGLAGSGLAGYLSVKEGFFISVLTGLGVVSTGLAWKGMEWVGKRFRNRGNGNINDK